MLLRGSGVSKITSPTPARARAREKCSLTVRHESNLTKKMLPHGSGASKYHLAGANPAARAPKLFSFSAPA
jgi:hypothetical protein